MPQLKRVVVFVAFVLTTVLGSTSYAAAQQRLALVIGQGAYEAGKLPTAANDAGLIAQTLTSAGFEVVQGRDLNGNDLRNAVRDFLDKVQAMEPGGAIMVYLSGYGVQLEGENYLLPVDARIQRDADVPLEGFRLSDLVRSLERAPAKVRIIVGDMARDYPFPSGGEPIAKGLALMEPPAGFLMAFSSAPNIVAADGPGPYGAYASALVEMIRQPGLPVDEVFARTRLRTHETTKGLQTPWHMANLKDAPFVFFELEDATAAAPVREVRRIEEVPAEEAYAIAVERDAIQDYQAFLRRFPDHPLARRVSALLAARREAIVWRRTVSRNTSEAYWTYLRRYPNGPHAADSRRRLARLAAPVAPPEVFEEVVYDDLPPPLPAVETIEVVEVVTIIREAPPPPPPPVYLLPDYEEEVEFVTIIREPPPPPIMGGILPIPAPIPLPRRARPPRYYYEPIAPITPRGPVAIPVATPIHGPLMGDRDSPRPPRGARPRPPVPQQPGLAAPPQPIPVVARPDGPRAPRPGAAGPEARPPRLPSRPIALPRVDRDPVLEAPGAAVPSRSLSPGLRPGPVAPSSAERPRRPGPGPGPGPALGPVPADRDQASRPRPVTREPDAPRLPDRPRPAPVAPQPARPAFQPREEAPRLPRPSAVEERRAPGPVRPSLEERLRPPPSAAQPRPAPREIERPRPVQPRPMPEFRRPEPQPRERPDFPRPSAPSMRPQPVAPRAAPPAMERPRPSAPEARPERPRRELPRPNARCRPGQPCPDER